MQIDLLSVDLYMVNSLLETHGIELEFGGGMIENLDPITQSYRDYRNLPVGKVKLSLIRHRKIFYIIYN